MHSREKSLYLTCLAISYEFYFTVSIKILKLNSSLAGRGKTEERRDRKCEVYYVVVVYSLIHVKLFDTVDCSPSDFPVHAVFQARILE